MTYSFISRRRYFVAGGVCAALSHGMTTPIDVVKTTIQADPERFSGKSLADASLDIVRRNGPLFLLAGLGPTLLGYGVEGALKFGFYETLKELFTNMSRNQAVNFIVASLLAGVIASIALVSLQLTK
jgi:solute carrier family 25 phosphate transporter 3